MKLVLSLIFGFLFSLANAQIRIPVSYFKNVNLIFDNTIVKGDVSSSNIFVSQDANILKVGASKPFNDETSITVLTDDNVFFTFLITYNESLTQLTYLIDDSLGIKIPYTKTNADDVVETHSGDIDAKRLDKLCELVYSAEPLFKEIGYSYKKISVELAGIWVNNDLLFFKLLMSNNSNISYDISSTNLYIKERTRLKKSSTQPIERNPVSNYGNPSIPPKSDNNIYIMVFDKFTISHDKKLLLEVVEKDGGRKIEFEIVKDLIIRAPVIN
ncbi:MAG: DUF4138 domain-containing protein [Ignavibacteria bacterium]|nr:DUF4138 domain-containing protein [Ignavibacteria bacterium]